jgi:hypothetical protein
MTHVMSAAKNWMNRLSSVQRVIRKYAEVVRVNLVRCRNYTGVSCIALIAASFFRSKEGADSPAVIFIPFGFGFHLNTQKNAVEIFAQERERY